MDTKKLKRLVDDLTKPKKDGSWCGSGYIGIDWTPVKLEALRKLKKFVDDKTISK